jgi:hypothetical protein
MTYKNEFPNFDYDLPNLGKAWEDNSWHNDSCPSLDYPLEGGKMLRIWFQESNPEERECGGKQFVLVVGEYGDSDHLMESDDLNEVLAYIKQNNLIKEQA